MNDSNKAVWRRATAMVREQAAAVDAKIASHRGTPADDYEVSMLIKKLLASAEFLGDAFDKYVGAKAILEKAKTEPPPDVPRPKLLSSSRRT